MDVKRPRSDGLPTASKLIQDAKKNLTESEFREWKRLDKETSRMWRNFWVRVLKNKGHSNSSIAHVLELSETTVRTILREERF